MLSRFQIPIFHVLQIHFSPPVAWLGAVHVAAQQGDVCTLRQLSREQLSEAGLVAAVGGLDHPGIIQLDLLDLLGDDFTMENGDENGDFTSFIMEKG